MKLGIFGGSFDPIHTGHLILADVARETAGLDQVMFIPAAKSPLKSHGPLASERQRMEMLQLAVGGNENMTISNQEIERKGVSFTVDTLESIHSEEPESELFLIVGSDSLADFGKWKDIRRICELAIPLVASRRGTPDNLDLIVEFVSKERMDLIRNYAFEFPWIEISSTELRERTANHNSIRYRTPRAVECYIQTAKLYLDSDREFKAPAETKGD